MSAVLPGIAEGASLNAYVWRGGENGEYRVFNVPRRENQTVLDVVTWIQRHQDSTLAYRFACRVGMCGSCAMTVNGKPRWTCRTHVTRVIEGDDLRIGPLDNLPIIKDLVVDMQPFFDNWQAAEGRFHPSTDRTQPLAAVKPQSKARRDADAAIECINCAVCYAACDLVRWQPDYLGPAALNRAWAAVNDERDAEPRRIMKAVSGDAGCHRCHGMRSCTAHCPVGLDPARSINGLKRRSLWSLLAGDSAREDAY